jgi:hypothetical protein
MRWKTCLEKVILGMGITICVGKPELAPFAPKYRESIFVFASVGR